MSGRPPPPGFGSTPHYSNTDFADLAGVTHFPDEFPATLPDDELGVATTADDTRPYTSGLGLGASQVEASKRLTANTAPLSRASSIRSFHSDFLSVPGQSPLEERVKRDRASQPARYMYCAKNGCNGKESEVNAKFHGGIFGIVSPEDLAAFGLSEAPSCPHSVKPWSFQPDGSYFLPFCPTHHEELTAFSSKNNVQELCSLQGRRNMRG